jgi:hypothetical protein
MVPVRALATILALSLASGTLPMATALAETKSEIKPLATVLSVDGKGVAKLRRKAGTETTVASLQQLQAGDKVITDDKTVVQLTLPDGTLVRIGINSEYRIESSNSEGSFTAWVFSLARGSIRALVEKGVPRKDAKFRVNTPAGTMGVRGTEFVLEHDVKTNITTLYTVEGKVGFGALDCERKQTCIEVKEGETSTIGKGAVKPSEIKAFKLEEITKNTSTDLKVAVGTKGEAALSTEEAATLAARLSVLAPMSELGKDPLLLDDTELLRAAQKASEELAVLQDTLLDRDKATREAMAQAARDGTLDDRVALGKSLENDGSEKDPPNGANAVKLFQKAADLESGKISAKDKPNAEKLLAKIKAQEKTSTAKAKALVASQKSGAGASSRKSDIAAQLKAASERLAETVRARDAAVAAGERERANELAEQAAKFTQELAQHERDRAAEEQAAAAVPDDLPAADSQSTATATQTTARTSTATASATATATATHRGCGKMAEDPQCSSPYTCDAKYLKCSYNKQAWNYWCVQCDKPNSLYYKRKADETSDSARVGGNIITLIVQTGADIANALLGRNSAPSRKCYKTERVCTLKMVPCDLSSGKRCTPSYKQNCQDKQVEKACN